MSTERIQPRTFAIVQDDTLARNWWRITRPYTWLNQKHGARMAWGYAPDVHDLAILDDTEVVVFTGAAPSRESWQALVAWMMAAKRKHGTTFVYDTDDDVFTSDWTDWMVESGMDAGRRTRGELEDVRELRTSLMTLCDGVTVSTGWLAVTTRQFTDKPIWIVPNAIDAPAFEAMLTHEYRRPDDVLIGWAGGLRRDADLVPMLRAWGRIAQRYPSVRFRLAGFAPREYERYVPKDRVEVLPWREINEYGRSMQVDIGCCLVPNTRFDACRSPIKAIEFGLAGAAVVASNRVYGGSILGVYYPGGETTFGYRVGESVETTDEWVEALSRYVESSKLRADDNLMLQHRIRNHHTLATEARHWSAAYRGIMRGERQEWDRHARAGSRIEAESAIQPSSSNATSTASMTSTEPSTRTARGTA